MTINNPLTSEASIARAHSSGGWFLPAVTGVLTGALLLVGMEFTSRNVYSRSTSTLLDCLVLRDPSTGVRGIPNCKCSEKWEETGVADYRLNECGDRTDLPCGPKKPGTYRIALLGSSIAAGLRVSQDATFAALLPAQLSAQMSRKVEVYNLAMRTETPHVVDMRIDRALAQKPDLLLWVVNPYDVGHPDEVITDAPKPPVDTRHHSRLASIGSTWNKESQLFRSEPAFQFLLDLWDETRMSFMVRHLLYRNQSLYVNAFLRQNDAAAGYLRIESQSGLAGRPSALQRLSLRRSGSRP